MWPVGLPEHRLFIFLIFWGNSSCFPQWPYQFTFPPTAYEDSYFYTPLPTLVIFLSSGYSRPTGMSWHPTVVLTCICLIVWYWAPFCVSIGHSHIFGGNVYSGSLPIFNQAICGLVILFCCYWIVWAHFIQFLSFQINTK
jgi:hypothetical protein